MLLVMMFMMRCDGYHPWPRTSCFPLLDNPTTMHALLTDLDQIQDASDNMKFSRNVLDHSDHLLLLIENCTAVLSNILLLQDISILPSEYFVMADLLRAVAGEDSDSDGEAGEEHDEEDAHLEKEPDDRKLEDEDIKKLQQPVHQGRLRLGLVHQVHTGFQSKQDSNCSTAVCHCVDHLVLH